MIPSDGEATRSLTAVSSRHIADGLIEDGRRANRRLYPVIADGRHADRDVGCWSTSCISTPKTLRFLLLN
jgi:hypothetical protein